jgi:CRP-like cAMP-binding protein
VTTLHQLLHIANPNRFLSALPPADYSLLAPHLHPTVLGQGATLHHADAAIDHVYFPQSGMASIVVTLRDGTMVETATLGRAGVVCANAALGSRHAVGTALVQIPGKASRMTVGDFQEAAHKSAAIRELAVRYNDLLMAQLQQSVACNALHDLAQRLCRWLLHSYDCCDGDSLPLTQEFLGEMLGVRRTSVTHAERRLQDAGIVSYRRGQMHIDDRAALESCACECYFAIQDRIDKVFPRILHSHAGRDRDERLLKDHLY